jgi:hypothetical protein
MPKKPGQHRPKNPGPYARKKKKVTAEEEKNALEKLEKALENCQKCGPTNLCKVNKNGEHVHLTFNQRRRWSVALAKGTRGVTLRTPPEGKLFADFHGSSSAEGTKAAVGADGILGGPFGVTATFPWEQILPFMLPGVMQAMAQTMPQGAAAVSLIPSNPLARNAPPSSDPPDHENQIQYLNISEFLTTLSDRHPVRALAAYHNKFERMDYYRVDELARMAEADLTGPDFRMTSGNAKFLLKEARDEVRRVERAAKRARTN